jgi:WD40 repeat protein
MKRTWIVGIFLLMVFLGACQGKPKETEVTPSPSAIALGFTPTPSGTPTPDLSPTQTATDWAQFQVTREAEDVLTPGPTLLATASSEPTLTLQPTRLPPSPDKLQVINRTNLDRLIQVGIYEPPQNLSNRSPTGFAFAPDGKTIAFSLNGEIDLWDLATGQVIQKFKNAPDHSDYPFYFSMPIFSPNSKYMASYFSDGLSLWDTSSGKQLWIVFAGDYGSIESFTNLTFSPDSQFVVTSSATANSDIRIWSAATGKQVKALGMDNQLDVDFSPDGNQMVTTDRVTGEVHILDGHTWQKIGDREICIQAVSLTFSPNGTILALTCEYDPGGLPSAISLLDPQDDLKKTGSIVDPKDQFPYIGSLPVFTPDGGIIAFSAAKRYSEDFQVVEFWDTTNSKRLSLLDDFHVNIDRVAFSPDGHLFVTRDTNGTAIFWGVLSIDL